MESWPLTCCWAAEWPFAGEMELGIRRSTVEVICVWFDRFEKEQSVRLTSQICSFKHLLLWIQAINEKELQLKRPWTSSCRDFWASPLRNPTSKCLSPKAIFSLKLMPFFLGSSRALERNKTTQTQQEESQWCQLVNKERRLFALRTKRKRARINRW